MAYHFNDKLLLVLCWPFCPERSRSRRWDGKVVFYCRLLVWWVKINGVERTLAVLLVYSCQSPSFGQEFRARDSFSFDVTVMNQLWHIRRYGWGKSGHLIDGLAAITHLIWTLGTNTLAAINLWLDWHSILLLPRVLCKTSDYTNGGECPNGEVCSTRRVW